MTAAIEFNLFV